MKVSSAYLGQLTLCDFECPLRTRTLLLTIVYIVRNHNQIRLDHQLMIACCREVASSSRSQFTPSR